MDIISNIKYKNKYYYFGILFGMNFFDDRFRHQKSDKYIGFNAYDDEELLALGNSIKSLSISFEELCTEDFVVHDIIENEEKTKEAINEEWHKIQQLYADIISKEEAVFDSWNGEGEFIGYKQNNLIHYILCQYSIDDLYEYLDKLKKCTHVFVDYLIKCGWGNYERGNLNVIGKYGEGTRANKSRKEMENINYNNNINNIGDTILNTDTVESVHGIASKLLKDKIGLKNGLLETLVLWKVNKLEVFLNEIKEKYPVLYGNMMDYYYMDFNVSGYKRDLEEEEKNVFEREVNKKMSKIDKCESTKTVNKNEIDEDELELQGLMREKSLSMDESGPPASKKRRIGQQGQAGTCDMSFESE